MRVKNLDRALVSKYELNEVENGIYDIPAVWYSNDEIVLIDQRRLPWKFEVFIAKDYKDVAFVIKDMLIRGAPAIGAMAVYGLAQAAKQGRKLEEVAEVIRSTRPTAYDLFFAVDYMLKSIRNGLEPVRAAEDYIQDTIHRCKKIGEFGDRLLKDGDKILTHCNAGALATVDLGTALGPMRVAHQTGKKIFVYVDETRPRLQGARLTAWELLNEDIPHALIADNAAGYYMSRNEIDIVITGADRVACNGDAANKIGTYEKAVLAYENNVPFYIAAPISTFDLTISDGSKIPIEERGMDEVLMIKNQLITATGTSALNPAFDVTPNKYIKGFITEFGIITPAEVEKTIRKNLRMNKNA